MFRSINISDVFLFVVYNKRFSGILFNFSKLFVKHTSLFILGARFFVYLIDVLGATEEENWGSRGEVSNESMKIGKTSGPSGVAIELLKAGGDKCLKSLTNTFNDILFKDKLLEEWMLSSLVPNFKGKEDPLNSNSYKGIKLLEHAFKLQEKILDGPLGEM